MEEICSYIEQKIYAKLSVQEVADFFQFSTRRLHQIFQQSCGMAPKQYISSRKIEKAKQILAMTAPTTFLLLLKNWLDARRAFFASNVRRQRLPMRLIK